MIWWPQAARFPRVESRRRARAFVLGLLAELPRKNSWTIAGHAGDASPGGMPGSPPPGWPALGLRPGPDLRAELEERRAGYVLAVACHHRVAVAAGNTAPVNWPPARPAPRGSGIPPGRAPKATVTTTGR